MKVSQVIITVTYLCVAGFRHVPEIIAGFKRKEFPNCPEATDGTRVPVNCLLLGASECENQKGYYSIILQTLVEHRGRFMNTNMASTGKVYDARVFKRAGLYL